MLILFEPDPPVLRWCQLDEGLRPGDVAEFEPHWDDEAGGGLGHGGDDGYAADGAGGLAFENGEELFGLLWREQSDDVGVFGHGLEVVLACRFNF